VPRARIGCGIIIALQHNNNISKVKVWVRLKLTAASDGIACQFPQNGNSERIFLFLSAECESDQLTEIIELATAFVNNPYAEFVRFSGA
jgi:hypothetical protein